MTPPVTPATRVEAIERLRSETFDVLILGGGINGAGVARDLCLRAKTANHPLRVGLVDANHFGSGTSGRNSHLIHGGLRYLKMFDFALVRESLREREILLRIAPHLVEPLPFLMPIAGFGREIFYNTGLLLYDFLSRGSLPRHRHLSLDRVRQLEPGLAVPGMTAGAEYYDAQVRSARLVLENIFEAIANGATCANYVQAEKHERDCVQMHDLVSDQRFEVRTKELVDATGPWARDPAPRLVRGSHIILPRLNTSDHAIAYFEESGRIIFFIPWGEREDRTLIGTTDVDHDGSADRVEITDAEISYLREIAAKVYPESAKYDLLATFSALRPLLVSTGPPTRASRDHRIFRDTNGVVRITGGKYTTYRSMSEEAADLVAPPELKHVHITADHPLNGNTRAAIDGLLGKVAELAVRYQVTRAEAEMIVKQYGVLAHCVLGCKPGDVDGAREIFAIQHEMAIYPRDFLEVSTTLALEGRTPALQCGAWLTPPSSV